MSTSKEQMERILQERIMVLDGAMGTMIQSYTDLSEEDFRGERFKDHVGDMKGNNDILSLTRPDIIKEIHASYLDVGADIIETNTFSGTSVAQADYNCQDVIYDLNYDSAQIAREVADEYTKKDPDKPRFVAGVLGPTNKTASISPDVTDPGYREIGFDDLAEAYKEQAIPLIEGGCDLLLIETVFDTLNCKAALYGLRKYMMDHEVEIPIMVSGTITDASGRTLSGQTVEAFWTSISHAELFSVGLNCALGAKDLKPYVERLARTANIFVSAHPNAGLPNEFGEYDQTPEEMANEVEPFVSEGHVNILGGCCGTKPEHLRELADLAAKYAPRELTAEEKEAVGS